MIISCLVSTGCCEKGVPMEAESKSNSNKRLIIILVFIVVIVAIVAAAAVMILRGGQGPAESVDISEGKTPMLGYAQGVVAIDEESLQAAVDEAFKASENQFITEFIDEATSKDGENFSCYIGNSDMNVYDMYMQIFADGEFTDQLFLSGLLRPGTVFEEIKIDHPLEPGTHPAVVVFTQVDDDHATIVGQVSVAMTFIVSE